MLYTLKSAEKAGSFLSSFAGTNSNPQNREPAGNQIGL